MLKFCDKAGQHAFQIAEYLIIRGSNDIPAQLSEFRLALLIVCPPIGVTLAIDFDNQLLLDAGKVDDEAIDGVLAAKLETGQTPVPQHTPEPLFRNGRSLSELPGEVR